MTLHLVLLPMILAASLASTEKCAPSVGSRMDLSVHAQKNASGHRIITVDTRRLTSTENQWELSVNYQQERRSCDSNEIEQLVSVTSVHPPLDDSSTEPTAPSTTTTAAAPKSCPQAGYQLFPEFNCYKGFTVGKSWSDARAICQRDGGDLMVAETERERKEVYIPLFLSVSFPDYSWMGVYIPQGGDSWMSVKGGPALSTWWSPGEPDEVADRKCGIAGLTALLYNTNCARHLPFICEIPVTSIQYLM